MLARTNINLNARQLAYAKLYCKAAHLSISEFVRQAIDAFLKQHATATTRSMFGVLKGKLPDGLRYQRECRKDED